ncbi:hypothetical protein BD560DRAFT_398188 [Blakeslea trispora]|nr:hypothetical protein BD560DRAFT_398188 [Blakeslea trispora]
MTYNNWQQNETHLPKVFQRLGRFIPHNTVNDYSSATTLPVDTGFKIAGHHQNTHSSSSYTDPTYDRFYYDAPSAHEPIPTEPAAYRKYRRVSPESYHRPEYISIINQDTLSNRQHPSPNSMMPQHLESMADARNSTNTSDLSVSPVLSASSSSSSFHGLSFVKNSHVPNKEPPSPSPSNAGRSTFSFVRNPYQYQTSPATPMIPTGPTTVEHTLPKNTSPERTNDKDKRHVKSVTPIMNERDRLAKNIQITVSRPSLTESSTEKSVSQDTKPDKSDQESNGSIFQPINRTITVQTKQEISTPPSAEKQTQRARSPVHKKRQKSVSPDRSDDEKAPFLQSKGDKYIPDYRKRPLPTQFRQERNQKKPQTSLKNNHHNHSQSHDVTPTIKKKTSPKESNGKKKIPSKQEKSSKEQTKSDSLPQTQKKPSSNTSKGITHRIITMNTTIVKPSSSTTATHKKPNEEKTESESVHAGHTSLATLSHKAASACTTQPSIKKEIETSQSAACSDNVEGKDVTAKTDTDNKSISPHSTFVHSTDTMPRESRKRRAFSDHPPSVLNKQDATKKRKVDETQAQTEQQTKTSSSSSAQQVCQSSKSATLEERREREHLYQLKLRQLDIDERDDIVMDVALPNDTSEQYDSFSKETNSIQNIPTTIPNTREKTSSKHQPPLETPLPNPKEVQAIASKDKKSNCESKKENVQKKANPLHSDVAVVNPQLLSPPMEKVVPAVQEPSMEKGIPAVQKDTTNPPSKKKFTRMWKVIMDDEGSIYYVNRRTGERTNVRPE